MKTDCFMYRYLRGQAQISNIVAYGDMWRPSGKESFEEHLGLTKAEYCLYCKDLRTFEQALQRKKEQFEKGLQQMDKTFKQSLMQGFMRLGGFTYIAGIVLGMIVGVMLESSLITWGIFLGIFIVLGISRAVLDIVCGKELS